MTKITLSTFRLLLCSLFFGIATSANAQNALHFDGTNDYIAVPNSAALNPSEFTIATWIKWERSGTAVDFIYGKGIETMEIHTGGSISNNIRFIPTPGVYLDGGVNTITPGTWVHLAVVYDPSQSLAKMYVNGVDIPLTNNGPNAPGTPVASSANNFIIGSRGNTNFPFMGEIDEFQFWDRALSQFEIQEYSNTCGINTTVNGPLINLHFNQGIANGDNTAVTAVTDASGFNNYAALVNFALNGSTSNFVSSSVAATFYSENVTTVNACDSYVWNGTTYTTSGIYIGTTTNCITEKLNLTITPTPDATITESLGTITATQAGATYQWYKCPNTLISGAISQNFTPTETGDYKVEITTNGCMVTSSCITVDVASALHFDGINDYIAVPNSPALNTSQFTIATWINWGGSGTTVNFICGKDYETMEIHTGGASSNNIRFVPTTGVYLDGGMNTITPGTWVHLAVVYDPSNNFAAMYVNGINIPLTNNGPNPIGTPMSSGTGDLIVGSRGNFILPFSGQMDEFQLWDRVLTQAEIQEYSNTCGINTTVDGPLINFHFNQGIANGDNTGILNVTDASGFNNHADLVNFALNGNFSNFVASSVGLTYYTENLSTVSACDNYVWNGTTYTSSGIYIGPTNNCVTEVLDLTITSSSNNVTTISVCDSYVWNGTTYTTSGIYTGTTTNCVTEVLDLTITPSSNNVTTISACDSYVWNGTTYTTSGIYTGTTTNCVTDQLDLTITATPSNNVTLSGATLTATAVGADYQWLICETNGTFTPINLETNQTFVPTSNGNYAVVVTNNGCTDTSACVSVTTVDLATIDKTEFSYYPNPVTDKLILTHSENISSVKFVDISGREVKTIHVNSNTAEINVAELPSAMYFVTITFENNVQTEIKVIKSN